MKGLKKSVLHIGEQCLICDETKESGIHLFNHYICEACERKIVSSEPKDAFYHEYLSKLRKINFPTGS